MNRKTRLSLFIGVAGSLLLITTLSAQAASTTQMKACKNAVLEKPKLHDFPMAAVSVRPGKKENRVAFTVRWEGASGHGNCRVSPDGYVKEVKLKDFHAGGRNQNNRDRDSGGYVEQDGFWRDSSGRWVDPDGEVCASCTPENGFPAADNGRSDSREEIDGFYYDRHMGQWRDPDGEVCHSCTAENGFPDQ